MTKNAIQICLTALLVLMPFSTRAASLPLATRLQGRILLQTQQHGEAWYVYPKDQKRYYLKDGATAYEMMRKFGLGITNVNLEKAQKGDQKVLSQIKGKIVLQVEKNGEAYYVNPDTLKLTYMKDGDAAYGIMRFQSLGISDANLTLISTGDLSTSMQTQSVDGSIQVNIGEVVTLSTIKVKVNAVSTSQQSVGLVGTATASQGNKFIIIDASITNTTNSTFAFDSAPDLIDQAGRRYRDYLLSSFSVKNYLIMRSLAPNTEERGMLLYEVPADSTSFKLEFLKAGTNQKFDIMLPVSAFQAGQAAYSGPFCTSSSGDCAGLKIRIDFDENMDTCGDTCKYVDKLTNTKRVYYLTVRGDAVSGKVVSQNLNSGTEQDYEDISSGTYDATTGKIDFTYGYYLYPYIQVDFRYIEHKGSIVGNQFTGTYQYSSSATSPTTGKVTSLPISVDDQIPRKGCTIKGDSLIYSGGVKTYYIPSSASYSSINIVQDWFCSEQDAVAVGYAKSLR